jgi:hypothetical protein
MVTVLYSFVGTRLLAYTAPAFPFLCLLAALALRRFFRGPRLVILCIALFAVYWFAERGYYALNYGDGVRLEGFNSRTEEIPILLAKARPARAETSPAPLIVCLDGFIVEKQQSIFYSDRPVVQAYLNVPPTAPPNAQQARYENVIPLRDAVAAQPTLIITRTDMAMDIASTSGYRLRVLAVKGPLVLGEIARN